MKKHKRTQPELFDPALPGLEVLTARDRVRLIQLLAVCLAQALSSVPPDQGRGSGHERED